MRSRSECYPSCSENISVESNSFSCSRCRDQVGVVKKWLVTINCVGLEPECNKGFWSFALIVSNWAGKETLSGLDLRKYNYTPVKLVFELCGWLFQAHRGTKSKGSRDPIRFLPALPSRYNKPAWQINPPDFILSDPKEEEASAAKKRKEFDIVAELSLRKLGDNAYHGGRRAL